ncbi:poly [ADP-ribose] polymerase tankyrase-2-like [Uloborus diversus]|uniref:poly [ADP-ribose] polymerase tankyrase-2-like n=1 Tax=Uloborus diversus TaxID=327109 RepID=UPI0024090C16|nr:poly [ADP-ribose] polymerase tankyrase-2-like [Uloborus diversus]
MCANVGLLFLSSRKRTALHEAVDVEDVVWLRKLLEEGSNTRARDETGQTPLHAALMRRKERIADILVDADCITDIEDEDGYTPLQIAAEKGCLRIIEKLIAGGADTARKDRQGRTLLHIALENSEEAAAEMLVGAIPDLNVPDRQGRTPLHWAGRNGHVQVARQLLVRGANPHMDTYSDLYPLQSALYVGQVPVAEVIVAHYALNDLEEKLREIHLSRPEKMWEKLLPVCKMEICRMKDTQVKGSLLSFCDLALRPASRLSQRLSVEAIQWLWDNHCKIREFPIYGAYLCSKLKVVSDRKSHENHILKSFSLLSPPLLPVCTEVILPFLPDADLQNLVQACKFLRSPP